MVLFFLLPFLLFSFEGLEYRRHLVPSTVWYESDQSVHVIEIDPELFKICPVKALDNGIGRESVVALGERHGALAAINGGFSFASGLPSGALKIGEWIALPTKPRGCIGWSADRAPKMDRLWVEVRGEAGGKRFLIDGFNRTRRWGEAVLYTPAFHKRTLTNSDGQEVIVVNGIVHAIQDGGSSKIPENGSVLSIQREHPLFDQFAVGMPFDFSMQIASLSGGAPWEEWETFDYIVGGTPILVHRGMKVTDFSAEQTLPDFLTYRFARTAVGVLPNGHWLFVVADKTGLIDGLTMNELANLMQDLGCIEALNLSGGNSATMYMEGEIKNTPSGEELRAVSDALIVLPKSI